MIIYESAGKLYTHEALAQQTEEQTRWGWDEALQGDFSFDFNEWLTEAKLGDLVKELEVID